MPSLEALIASDIEVVAVFTNPDRPAGRGMDLQPSPIKQAAVSAGVPVHQPEKVRDPEVEGSLEAMEPDVAVVVAYGKILPAGLLEIPRLGFVNVHFSLLPAYRGGAPVQRALMDGVRETGVSIMVLTEGMDEGPVLATRALEVGPEETAGEVGERLAGLGAPLVVESLHAYASGELAPVEQDHSLATYADKITSEGSKIDWRSTSNEIKDFVRGLNPVPGAWTTLGGKRLKVHAVRPVRRSDLEPGALSTDEGLMVGTGDGAVSLTEVQPAGKRRMSGEELARGLRPSNLTSAYIDDTYATQPESR